MKINFHGTNKKYSKICRNCKIVIPKQLEKQDVEWYHNASFCPGEICTELSISQHCYWKNLCKTVHRVCTKYNAWQFLKRNKKHYRKIPPREAETRLRGTLCVDLISKYQFISKLGGKKFQIAPKWDKKNFNMTTK